MRAIDADALIPMMKYATTDSEIGVFPIKIGFNDIEKVINEQPTIEPERKKGKWILVKGSNGKDYHKCSECLHTQEITGVKNYCAVCGAEMVWDEG